MESIIKSLSTLTISNAPTKKAGLVYDIEMNHHNPQSIDHPESPGRLTKILKKLKTKKLLNEPFDVISKLTPISEEIILLAHTKK